jgi:hypothetical protein
MTIEQKIRDYYLSDEQPSMMDCEREFNVGRYIVKKALAGCTRGPHEARRKPYNKPGTDVDNRGKSIPAVQSAARVVRPTTVRYLRRRG